MPVRNFMKSFLKQHDFIYERPPMEWVRGMPLANGMLGAMVWGDGKPLVLTLDRVDLWELRRKPIDYSTYNYANLKKLLDEGDGAKVYETFGQRFGEEGYNGAISQTRLTPGRIEILFGPKVTGYGARLDLYAAQVAGAIRFERGRAAFRCFVDSVRDVIVMDVRLRDGATIRAIRSRPSKYTFPNLGYPDPETGRTRRVNWRLQRQTGGSEYAVAWRVIKSQNRDRYTVYSSVASSRTSGRAVEEAVARVEEAVAFGFNALFREHAAWWAAYWNKSFVTIPDSHIESLYYAELYKMGSQSRERCPFPSGQGVWCPDDGPVPWSGQYGFNLNEQMDSWISFTSNHVETAMPMADLLWDWLPVNREICRKFYGVEGATLIHGSDLDGYEVPGWYCANLWAGCGPWACHTLWCIYTYTQDKDFLRERVYPIMKAHMGQYRGILEQGGDGKWHVPRSPSPEWLNNEAEAWGRDDSGNLALARWLSGALLQAEEALDLKSPDAVWWQDVRDNIAPCPADASGLLLMEDTPLTDSHRTLIQLLAIHPLDLLTCEGGEAQRELIRRSLATLVRRGMGTWCGYTVSWLAIVCARVSMAWRAHAMLKLYTDMSTIENSFHVCGDPRSKGFFTLEQVIPTIEGGFAAGGALLEMLLQSWHGTIRIFPAVPPLWGDAAFDRLRAEGAFLVSARRKRGRTTWVRIESEAGTPCRVRNPFGGPARVEEEATGRARRLNGATIRFETKRGDCYTLTPWGQKGNASLPKYRRDARNSNWFGIKEIPRF